MKNIYIPHLHYHINVYFDSEKYLTDLGIEAGTLHSKGLIEIHFKKKPNDYDFPTVAHEVMHALQFICKDRKIDMTNEVEHCGYLMQYILNQILGYEYVDIK